MKIKTIQNIKATILGLIIAISAGYAVAAVNTGVFTPPECSPPGCNTPAPINVGPLGQYKEGGLTVGDTDMSKLDSAVKFAVPKGTSFFLNMLSDGAVVTRSLNFLSPGATPSLSLPQSVKIKSDKDQNISFFDMKLNRNVFSVDNGTVEIKNGSEAPNKVLTSDTAGGRASWKYIDEVTIIKPGNTVGPGGIQRGRIPVSCVRNNTDIPLNWGDNQTDPLSITFPKPFSGTPNVVVTLQWAAWTGDEPTSVWVTGIGSTGFVLHIKTPDRPKKCDGEMFAQWIAIGN